MRILLRLPLTYGDDVIRNRQMPVGLEVNTIGNQMVIESDPEGLTELLEDAEFYAANQYNMFHDDLPLVRSARRALPHIRRAIERCPIG